MNKKISKKDNSAADDLFSSLLDDVGGFDNFNPDHNEVLEDTVYGDKSVEEFKATIDLAEQAAPLKSDFYSDENKLEPASKESKPVVVKAEKTEVMTDDIFKSSVPEVKLTNVTPKDTEQTIAVTKFAQRQKHHLATQESHLNPQEDKIFLNTSKSIKVNTSQISIDASLAQSENLRIAQNRILELEREIERLRQENDEILTATEIIKNKSEEFTLKISHLEKENSELKLEFKNENSLLKGSLVFKESENAKLQEKIDELELRIKNDFKKIRIRERELENRLELMRAEKQAVIKSKDELLLELQRKNDISKSELETYRNKVQELNKTIESYQNQIKITVRTLRLALSHVEDKSESQPIHYKKAT